MIGILQAPNLAGLEWVRYGFTTRGGGVSSAPYDSLNLRFLSEDAEENVRENFARVAEVVGLPLEQFVMTEQTHSTNVRAVTAEDAGRGVVRDGFEGVDGLMTNVPGLVLAAYCADCALIYVVDANGKAVGIAHAGGVGTQAGMAGEIVRRMCAEYNLQPAELVCAVSPCICGNCYEFDIKAANFGQLVDAGVPAENIFVSEHCTCEETDLFFSHRASAPGHTGRQIGFVGLS